MSLCYNDDARDEDESNESGDGPAGGSGVHVCVGNVASSIARIVGFLKRRERVVTGAQREANLYTFDDLFGDAWAHACVECR